MTMNYDTICSVSTGSGKSAISIIIISGKNAFKISNKIFKNYKKIKISKNTDKQVHLGRIIDEKNIIDQVVVTNFNGPKSYTGENIVEISFRLYFCNIGMSYATSK